RQIEVARKRIPRLQHQSDQSLRDRWDDDNWLRLRRYSQCCPRASDDVTDRLHSNQRPRDTAVHIQTSGWRERTKDRQGWFRALRLLRKLRILRRRFRLRSKANPAA